MDNFNTYSPDMAGSETYIPGMVGGMHQPAAVPTPGAPEQDNTPVVGFLYSISRDGFPEYWPLHVGMNKIGKAPDMDICLRENTVSDHHANLNIKRMRTAGNRLVASLVDVGSKNGVMLNDEELDFDPHSCKTDDIIVIGCNYKLVLLLADPVHYKLDIAPDFEPCDAAAPVPPVPPRPNFEETFRINGIDDGLEAGGTVTL